MDDFYRERYNNIWTNERLSSVEKWRSRLFFPQFYWVSIAYLKKHYHVTESYSETVCWRNWKQRVVFNAVLLVIPTV